MTISPIESHTMMPQQRVPASQPEAAAAPWWRFGIVWLVVGGPLLVVVASLVTAVIAVSGAEEVLTRPAPSLNAGDAHLLPAVQGRNHAATPKN
jgi:uncharacterized protein